MPLNFTITFLRCSSVMKGSMLSCLDFGVRFDPGVRPTSPLNLSINNNYYYNNNYWYGRKRFKTTYDGLLQSLHAKALPIKAVHLYSKNRKQALVQEKRAFPIWFELRMRINSFLCFVLFFVCFCQNIQYVILHVLSSDNMS